MTEAIRTETEPDQAGWRLRLGLIIFVVGFLSPLLIPLVTASPLSIKLKTVISGGLAVGIPELFSIVAIAIMGKSGFNYIKKRFFRFLKKHAPADSVSRIRYRIGLIMFTFPILFGWLTPYFSRIVPDYDVQGLPVILILDATLIVSVFVLGGDFWDKVHGLFIHGATIRCPASSSSKEER